MLHKIRSLLLFSLCFLPYFTLAQKGNQAESGHMNQDSVSVVTTGINNSNTPNSLNTKVFNPDPMKAVWYSALLPGLGQIYNRKYWKLPIIYGGYLGLTYAVTWNGRYYKDYSIAYRDAMDNDPNTTSYLDFARVNFNPETDIEQLKVTLKRGKDFYRRNRDLSIISMVGLYLLCMVDAYVDAELYNFNISPDISMRIEPTIIEQNKYNNAALGLQCSIKF